MWCVIIMRRTIHNSELPSRVALLFLPDFYAHWFSFVLLLLVNFLFGSVQLFSVFVCRSVFCYIILFIYLSVFNLLKSGFISFLCSPLIIFKNDNLCLTITGRCRPVVSTDNFNSVNLKLQTLSIK